MIYSEDFLRALPPDVLDADRQMLSAFEKLTRAFSDENHDNLIESFAAYQAFRSSRDLPVKAFVPSDMLSSNWDTMVSLLHDYQNENSRKEALKKSQAAFQRGDTWFQAQSGALFLYEFTDDDIKQIRELLAEIGSLISGTDELEAPHKARLARRLDQLEKELAKKVSDLDRFWGLFGDVNVVIRKLAGDSPRAKLVRRAAYALAYIIFNAQHTAHQLPPVDQRTYINAPTYILEDTVIDVAPPDTDEHTRPKEPKSGES